MAILCQVDTYKLLIATYAKMGFLQVGTWVGVVSSQTIEARLLAQGKCRCYSKIFVKMWQSPVGLQQRELLPIMHSIGLE